MVVVVVVASGVIRVEVAGGTAPDDTLQEGWHPVVKVQN